MKCVDIRQLNLAFGEQIIFQNFEFSLTQGRFTSLLGGSGVGKSTLLRIIAGLETQFTAHIQFAPNTTLAYLSQQDTLYPWLSILDNVQLYAHLTGTKNQASADRAYALLSSVKMQQHVHKTCYQLSGGQRQRVALARTLMQEANLVLMDEPFSALDAITRHELQDLTSELLVNKTVLLITHDPQEAIRLSDDIYILQHQPAVLSSKICPTGQPPRPFDDIHFGQLHAQLLNELRKGSLP